jgi:hypothetical protein
MLLLENSYVLLGSTDKRMVSGHIRDGGQIFCEFEHCLPGRFKKQPQEPATAVSHSNGMGVHLKLASFSRGKSCSLRAAAVDWCKCIGWDAFIALVNKWGGAGALKRVSGVTRLTA